MKKTALVLMVLLAIAGWATASGTLPRAIDSALLLGDLLADGKPSLLKRLTARPARQSVTIGDTHADLYLPAEKARAGLVLVPGADRSGKDHPRLVALAETLARLRFLVVVPDIANLRRLELAGADRRPIANAAGWLASDRHLARVGVVAVSYGVLPAVHAALDETAVTFLLGIGGAYDLKATATFFTTGAYREGPGQDWMHAVPNAYGKWVFVRSNLGRLDDSADRAAMDGIAQRRLNDPAAGIGDLVALLKPQGRAVMALLDNTDPARVPALLDKLPPRIKAEIAQLDLAPRDLSPLTARLILVHGQDDRIIPWTESAALARMAPRAQLFVPTNLAHAELRPSGLADAVILWRAALAFLEAAGP
ncbi:hypothetical protein [Magnetospirillum moscoviense]|uniref:Alpha/beta hydrolase n=1 Tax=Magnetospirillum moscoviense TaxID=1437059 RepID=A0A178MPN1_9PROT|nr:hypothetical protein [Magnetospirillum moscoviense]OAN49904.1 hypothetical protein A6A05_12830 [Magnetospirillum moscoviense]